MSLIEQIKFYYEARGLSFPNFDNAMKFVQTELAEVYELDLARIGGWVRNNPQNKREFSKAKLAEELGDAIFMLVVAGIAEGVDPIEALVHKMHKKLNEKKATITGQMEIVTQEQANEIMDGDTIKYNTADLLQLNKRFKDGNED